MQKLNTTNIATNKTQKIWQQLKHNKYCYKINRTNIATNLTQQILLKIQHNKYSKK